jgi:hypothetical protein
LGCSSINFSYDAKKTGYPWRLIAPTDSWVAAWMLDICWPISPVAFAVCSASAFTSDATTAAGFARARRLDGGVERQQVGPGPRWC